MQATVALVSSDTVIYPHDIAFRIRGSRFHIFEEKRVIAKARNMFAI
jgi:hypothetical protein